jgi:phosphoribosylformimino-5-aminoimidazole carboxamide ribotide isomerase
MSDIAELEAIGCTGVIVGKAIYEGKIALQELADYVS